MGRAALKPRMCLKHFLKIKCNQGDETPANIETRESDNSQFELGYTAYFGLQKWAKVG